MGTVIYSNYYCHTVIAEYNMYLAVMILCSTLGFLGCSANVLPDIHAACSGKSECSFSVIDLYTKKPCRGLPAYLEVTYECVKGTSLLCFCAVVVGLCTEMDLLFNATNICQPVHDSAFNLIRLMCRTYL